MGVCTRHVTQRKHDYWKVDIDRMMHFVGIFGPHCTVASLRVAIESEYLQPSLFVTFWRSIPVLKVLF